MAKKKATKTVTLPADLSKTPIEIAGRTYDLCYDMDAMADAEEHFNMQGANANLLRSLASLRLKAVRNVFACALHTYHPEISFAEAQKMLTIQASYEVAAAMVAIWSPAAAGQVATVEA